MAKRAFPFRITHILTDRGSCFTADAFEEACTHLKVPHWQTKAYMPQTNGMVERFNVRIASDVLGINVADHADLEILLTSFNHAYNRRRQRVMLGHSPMEKVEQRLTLKRNLANSLYKPPANQQELQVRVDRILYMPMMSHNLTANGEWHLQRFAEKKPQFLSCAKLTSTT